MTTYQHDVSVARPIIAFYSRFRDICIYIYVRVTSRNRTLAHIRRFEKMADEVARPKIVFTGLPEGYQTSFWAEDFGIFIICFIAAKKDEPKCPLLPI